MTSCPRPCPLCAGREFYLLPVGGGGGFAKGVALDRRRTSP